MSTILTNFALESNVRSYCRECNAIFSTANAANVIDSTGKSYIDFFAGAGSLNYGHNNPTLKKSLIEYINKDGISNTLDFHSVAKSQFIEKFDRTILKPRGLDYKLQFTGPTGANAVEAALKLARKIKGRPTVGAFTHAFHGVSLGALAATAQSSKRSAAGVELSNVVRLPYDGFLGPGINTSQVIKTMLGSKNAGFNIPAAIILEVVQAEGGLNTASSAWLQEIQNMCQELDILLIIDDIQAGCGRTGPFFSFETSGISPDIICLSKSISGYGLPMSLVLIKPEHDHWQPGEHNGTFRGNNLAFVTATAALKYWENKDFQLEIEEKSKLIKNTLETFQQFSSTNGFSLVGRGMLTGLKFIDPNFASKLAKTALTKGLLVETCGPSTEVLKLMPPLTIDLKTLTEGLEILRHAHKETR